ITRKSWSDHSSGPLANEPAATRPSTSGRASRAAVRSAAKASYDARSMSPPKSERAGGSATSITSMLGRAGRLLAVLVVLGGLLWPVFVPESGDASGVDDPATITDYSASLVVDR